MSNYKGHSTKRQHINELKTKEKTDRKMKRGNIIAINYN